MYVIQERGRLEGRDRTIREGEGRKRKEKKTTRNK
jgi:hypothetical protein